MTLLRQFKSIRQFVWWLFAVLAIGSSTAWAAVGYVHEATGAVFAQRGSGAAELIKVGDTFEPGTTFRTAGDGTLVIKFADGQLASLRPNTTFRVDQYSFNANSPRAGISAVSLIQGAMRFVTGVIGSTNHNNVRFSAGVATTIGIRGTDITVLTDETTQAVLAAIANGAAVLETTLGAANIGPDQYASFTGGTSPIIANLSSAPAVTQAIINALHAAPLPPNTPVNPTSAAAAAAAVVQARAAQAALDANPTDTQLQLLAQQAADRAETAIQTAVNEAQALLQTAIKNGAIVPTPSVAPPQSSAPAPAPSLLQRVEEIIRNIPCTGSPC